MGRKQNEELVVKVNYQIKPSELPVENIARMFFRTSKENLVKKMAEAHREGRLKEFAQNERI